MNLEEAIKDMGYSFRDLTYHSNGLYSCRLGFNYLKSMKGQKEFWGENPMEAVVKANNALIDFEKSLEEKESLNS